jgi:hypothetical protein
LILISVYKIEGFEKEQLSTEDLKFVLLSSAQLEPFIMPGTIKH